MVKNLKDKKNKKKDSLKLIRIIIMIFIVTNIALIQLRHTMEKRNYLDFHPRKLNSLIESMKILILSEKLNWRLRAISIQLWHIHVINEDDQVLPLWCTLKEKNIQTLNITTNANQYIKICLLSILCH